MRILANTKNIPHSEWLKLRRKGIGGSDCAAVLGMSDWNSPLGVYMDKIGELDNEISSEAAEWGNLLEDLVAMKFAEETGKKVHRVNQILMHDEYDFLLANIDRKVTGENAILECKTTNAFNKDKWEGDEIPKEYILQVLHYMMVTNTEKAYIACLIGGQRFVWKEVPRDEETIRMMLEGEIRFWNEYVLKKTPPPFSGLDADTEILKQKYPDSEPGQIALPDTYDAKCFRKEELDAEIKRLKSEQELIKQEIAEELKNTEKGITLNYDVFWKLRTRRSFNTETFKSAYPDLYNKYVSTTTYKEMRFKRIKTPRDKQEVA